MPSASGTLVVITNRGDVFGADVNGQNQNIDPVFAFGGGVRIGFNAQDRFMVPLYLPFVDRILTVITNNGSTFGSYILGNNTLGPEPPFGFTGARIGFNVQDRFMVAIGNTPIVITNDGSAFGANVTVQNTTPNIGPVFEFTGAKIGFNVQDRFMVALNGPPPTLIVITDDGSAFGANVDITGQNIGPVFEFTGAKIGFNVQDRFMVALEPAPIP
jgi:hypothetical protein